MDSIQIGAEFKPILTITHDDALVFHDRKDRRIMIKKERECFRIYKETFDTEKRPYWENTCFVSDTGNDITLMLHEVISMIYRLKNKEAENFLNPKE